MASYFAAVKWQNFAPKKKKLEREIILCFDPTIQNC
jgi:hypothetical protein